MQWVTNQSKLTSVVAVLSALQATVTRHVKNAQCGFASIISVTVSSCIIRSTVLILRHMNWYLTLPMNLNFTVSVLVCGCFWHSLYFCHFAVHFSILVTKLQVNYAVLLIF